MTTRVTLISPALSAALREARFADGPLDAAGLRQAEAVRGAVADAFAGAGQLVFASPSLRCEQSAEALGLVAETLPELRACAMGRWRGLRLDEVAATEPQAVAAWLADPAAAPHGGESLEALHGRVGHWLDALPADARVLAVAEPDVVRALTVHAIGAPAGVFWRIDVLPLTATELSGRNGRWNLRGGRPLGGASH
ncbi:bifunctional RNase H/acid phosphatase [Streptomyces sp. S4.7]|uniref:histidine phosphatase family protein n=1 Tax=Streptomyces sp. S4.7 TaxID=2705439 RepID=UPI0013984989|nr:histidine phosphatase family protein [Streptomyces sp. S4.7]QHY97425.1 bifunctional RNase H/acid phosphatase [Streptomyces sp. S4.7]